LALERALENVDSENQTTSLSPINAPGDEVDTFVGLTRLGIRGPASGRFKFFGLLALVCACFLAVWMLVPDDEVEGENFVGSEIESSAGVVGQEAAAGVDSVEKSREPARDEGVGADKKTPMDERMEETEEAVLLEGVVVSEDAKDEVVLPPVMVKLISHPKGAKVVFNKEVIGRTPFNFAVPDNGDSLSVTLEKSGHYRKSIKVSSALGPELSVVLKRKTPRAKPTPDRGRRAIVE